MLIILGIFIGVVGYWLTVQVRSGIRMVKDDLKSPKPFTVSSDFLDKTDDDTWKLFIAEVNRRRFHHRTREKLFAKDKEKMANEKQEADKQL